MKETLYAAYGSNMNLAQMEKRCPQAKPLGVGLLQNYELLFRGPDKKVFATVEPKQGKSVPVVLWWISPEDEAALDEYEEFPDLYRKETLPVEFEGKICEAMIYLINSQERGIPSTQYYEGIAEGYRNHSVELEGLELALKECRE